MEQQRSILAMRLKNLGGNPESVLKKLFSEISDGGKNSDQKFLSFDLFNLHLREEGNSTYLDMEEFMLFNTSCNNYYDSDSEISENEFIQFLIPYRKNHESFFRTTARKLGTLNKAQEVSDL